MFDSAEDDGNPMSMLSQVIKSNILLNMKSGNAFFDMFFASILLISLRRVFVLLSDFSVLGLVFTEFVPWFRPNQIEFEGKRTPNRITTQLLLKICSAHDSQLYGITWSLVRTTSEFTVCARCHSVTAKAIATAMRSSQS